jgi:glycine cleavage system H protein
MREPARLKYTREHEWLEVEGDTGTVGITDFAQKELGDIVYVELPTRGARLAAGKPMGSVESVKAVSEIYAPVGGEVVEVNGELSKAPELINRDPYGAGWMVRLRIDGAAQGAALLDLAGYEAYLQSEKQGA